MRRMPVPMTNSPATREEWFEDAVEGLTAHFEMIDTPLPPVKISCSWPGGGSARKRLGECWRRAASSAGINEIFISPLVSDPVQALAILMHELIHAADDCQSGHKAWFSTRARALGLDGKITSTFPNARLKESLTILADILGPYPHHNMTLPAQVTKPKSTTKFVCDECKFNFIVNNKLLNDCEADPDYRGLVCPKCATRFASDAGELDEDGEGE